MLFLKAQTKLLSLIRPIFLQSCRFQTSVQPFILHVCWQKKIKQKLRLRCENKTHRVTQAKTINATKILIGQFNKLLKQTCNTNSCGEHQRLGKNYRIYRFYRTYYLLHTFGWKYLLISVLIKAYLESDLWSERKRAGIVPWSHIL